MDLDQDARRQARRAECLIDTQHGDFHDVGRSPLDGRIDGCPFSKAAAVEIAVVDVRQIPPAPHERRHIAPFPGPAMVSSIYRCTP